MKLYVGQHRGTDLTKYLSKKFWDANNRQRGWSHLHNAMRAHPQKSWSIWPLVSGVQSQKELDELERHFIRVLKTQNPEIGYNLRPGGAGTKNISDRKKWRARLSTSLRGKGHPWTPEMWAKLAGPARVVSEETRQRQSKAAKKRASTSEGQAHLRRVGQMSKSPRSAEHRQHLSEALTGKKQGPRSADIRARISTTMRAKGLRPQLWQNKSISTVIGKA